MLGMARPPQGMGVKVSRLMARPRQSLAVCDGRNDPWPQSCWMIKSRTSSPDAGTASSRVNQYRPWVANAMIASKAPNSVAVVISWNRLRFISKP